MKQTSSLMNTKATKRGFTLIELLIVIAILAVLGVAVVLVLNPAELVRQSRDSTRIADVATLNSAIAFYLSDLANPDLGGCAANGVRVTAATPSSPINSVARTVITTVDQYGVDNSGWVDIKFTDITGGSPISKLPRDPINSITAPANNFYAYACDESGGLLKYEINVNMESAKYRSGGTSDVESKDGGDNTQWYEAGNSLTL